MVRKKPAQPTESVMITKDGRAEFKLGGELENGTLSQAMDVERMSSTPNEITDSHRNLKTPLVTFPKRVRRNSEGIMITIEKLKQQEKLLDRNSTRGKRRSAFYTDRVIYMKTQKGSKEETEYIC